MSMNKLWLLALAILLVGCASSTGNRRSVFSFGPEQKRLDAARAEIEYAHRLLRAGMPDYAESVLAKIPPDVKQHLMHGTYIRLISSNNFSRAEEEIAQEPDQSALKVWKMKLILADSYFAWGKYEKANSIFEEFNQYYSESKKTWPELSLDYSRKYAIFLEHLAKKDLKKEEIQQEN